MCSLRVSFSNAQGCFGVRSGSVISAPLARDLGLQHQYFDGSQRGVAAGVGRAQILGKLRAVPVTGVQGAAVVFTEQGPGWL